MSTLIFTGTNTQLLWQNEPSINNPGSNPNPTGSGFPFGTMGSQRNYDPFSTPITWSPSFPLINNLSVNQVINLLFGGTESINNYSLSGEIVFTISGNQFHSLSVPTININIYTSPTSQILNSVNIVPVDAIAGGSSGQQNYCSANGTCPSFTYNIPSQISPFAPYIVQVVPWNDGSQVITGNLLNFTLSAVMTIRLTVTCVTGPELETRVCMSYCQANLQQCKAAYTDFCFTESSSNPPVIPLTTDNACQLYFEQYYNVNGPDADIDSRISNYCQAKFPVTTCFEPLFFGSPPISSFEQELCACHLSETCYQNYIDSLANQAPAFVNYIRNSGIKDRCLISECASSQFPSIEIGKVCLVPACINVVNFNNNGSVGNGGVTITQDAECERINNTGGAGGTGANPPGEQSWWDKHWIWIVVGAGLLLVLIIIIIIIIVAESKKKKKPIYPR